MKSIFVFAIFASLSCCAQSLTSPNIIHILADDVGYDDLACFGAKDVRTPSLDKLAAEGLKLNNFYAPHGTCTPSRVALMTGKYVSRINKGQGMRVLFPTDSTGLDPQQEKSLAMYLKEAGYQTGLFGKWHLGHLPQYLPTKHGFDVYLGIPYPNDHGPERRGNTGLWQGFGAFPPIPLIQQDQVIKELDNNDLAELPALFVRESCRFMRQCVANQQPFYLQYANIETHTPWFLPKGFEGRSGKGAYVDAVEYLDMSVGILLDQLKALGLEQNTLVIFSSDNGPITHTTEELYRCYGKYAEVDSSRKHMLRGGKQQERYEGGIRVSCLVKWPQVIKPAQASNELVSSMDFFVTLLKVARANLPQNALVDGLDLQPLFQGTQKAPLRENMYGFTPAGELVSLRQKNWKLVLPDLKKSPKSQAELYDLSKDPGEKTDLAVVHAEQVKKLLLLAEKAKTAIKEGKPLAQ
jgi:arylsulfatase A